MSRMLEANRTKKKIEILAPAGSFDILKTAFAAGADAVYAGGSHFGARAYAANFTEEELLEAIDYTHLHGKKLYLTVNTLIKEQEMEQLYRYLLPYYRQGLDAVIVQDMGAMEYIREQFPGLELHASTQMTVTNAISAKFLEEKHVARVVPARELSLAEVRKIADQTDMDIECFVHGALCYCYSGQCLMSSMIGGRSGNRGQCAQPCRLPWRTEGRPFADLLSLKDLCTIEFLPELIAAGINSFKIEGRMKQGDYVESVVRMYRKYTDRFLENAEKESFRYQVAKEDLDLLMRAYRRRGYSDGYYHRHNGRQMLSLKRPETAPDPAGGTAVPERVELQRKITGSFLLSPGENAQLILRCGSAGEEVRVKGDVVQEALKQPMSAERLERQLRKTGGTEFLFEKIDVRIDGDVFLPIQAVNELRRDGLKALREQILTPYRRTQPAKLAAAEVRQEQGQRSPAIQVLADTWAQAEAAAQAPLVSRIYVEDSACILSAKEGLHPEVGRRAASVRQAGKEVYLSLARIYRSDAEDVYSRWLPDLLKHFDGALVRNLETLLLLKKLGFPGSIVSDASAYQWNRRAQQFWREQGVSESVAPAELNMSELRMLDTSRMVLPIYGYFPVMVTAGCIRKNTGGCTRKSGWLDFSDRMQKTFPVKNECLYCYNILYNTSPLFLADKKEEIRAVNPSGVLLAFTVESAERTAWVLDQFHRSFTAETPEEPWLDDFTRGHFKRGVK